MSNYSTSDFGVTWSLGIDGVSWPFKLGWIIKNLSRGLARVGRFNYTQGRIG